MPALSTIKAIAKALPFAIIAALAAMCYILMGQKENAKRKLGEAKAKAKGQEKARNIEQNISQNQEKARQASNEEKQRQDDYRNRGERPEYFGDSRMHDD